MLKFRSSNTSSYAFLFNASDPLFNGWYGGPCEDVLLESLFRNDIDKKCHSLVLIGDLIIRNRAEKFLSVSRKKEFGNSKTTSYTIGVDKEMYTTMFWDFLDSISSAWHTTNDEDLPLSIIKRDTFIIYLPTVQITISKFYSLF